VTRLSLVQGKQWTLLLLHHLINTVHTLTGDTAIPSSGKTVDSPTSTSLNLEVGGSTVFPELGITVSPVKVCTVLIK
jgi:hypothetical protein